MVHFAYVALAFLGLLLLAAVSEPLLKKLRVPFSAALVACGFIASEVLVACGIDTGIRWHNFHQLVFYVFIPILVFESALNLDLRALCRDALAILGLSVPLMLIGALIVAGLVYLAIGHSQGFPWLAALLLGILLSATDPSAVVATLKESGASERLQVLLEGESLFNDATAIVCFAMILGMALSHQVTLNWQDAVSSFLSVFFGGVGCGLAAGLLAHGAMALVERGIVQGLVTILCAYSAYLIAEELLHVSGVMSVLSAGLYLGAYMRAGQLADSQRFAGELWQLLAYIAGASIFVLAGVTVTLNMFHDRWLAMLIGIAAALIARAIIVYMGLGLIVRLPGVNRLSFPHQRIVYWGGVRGAVTLGLALSLPLELDYWYTIQSIAYGVVMFSLFVQAPLMIPLISRDVRPA